MHVLILGCGYTGRRVARRFLARGARVTATTRDPRRVADLGVQAIELADVPRHLSAGILVLHSIPPECPPAVLDSLGDAPARLVYLSTTGVYGPVHEVDEFTLPDPHTGQHRLRLEAERSVAAGPWSSLILRPAAIYGPGRGVHESLKNGSYRLGANFVSRIHVDDLAAHVEAGLLSDVGGAYPVADEEPCTSSEIAEFCAKLLNLPLPDGQSPSLRSTDRRVDGSAIRRSLGIELAYPSYRTGIPAALAPPMEMAI